MRDLNPQMRNIMCLDRERHCGQLLLNSQASFEYGFTFIEAVVGLMITMISLTISLHMFISTAYMQARSRQLHNVYSQIQQDFESVRAKAAEFESDSSAYAAYCNEPVTSNYAARFIEDTTVGLGGKVTQIGTENLKGIDYKLMRKARYLGTANPKSNVSLEYALVSPQGGDSLLDIEAEVLINASLEC